jgi:hypothetical protein
MIAAIGDRESILPFRAFGIKSIEVSGISEARKVIALIKPGEYSVVFVTEEIMQALEQVDSGAGWRSARAQYGCYPRMQGKFGIRENGY